MTDDLPLFQPTSFQRRMIDAAVEIEECTPDTVEFLHAVLCQVGLPRSSTKERVFERNNGRASIRIDAGGAVQGREVGRAATAVWGKAPARFDPCFERGRADAEPNY